MPDSEDEHRVVRAFKTVQRNIPGVAARDQDFAQSCASRSADQGMIRENAHGALDQRDGALRRGWIAFAQEFDQLLKLIERLA